MSESKGFVGQYFRYPEGRAGRIAEGGRRLKNITRESRAGEPLVTVVTVCFNSAKTIEQTIRSILGQTYSNIEYVIVDGASSDATLEIVRRYETKIDYYVSEPDDGLYYAMNKGLELAQGDYILFLNSDDWYTPDAVESLVNAKDYSGCDFVSALANYVDNETGAENTLRAMPFDHSQYLRMSLRHETMLVSAKLYNRLGPYDTRYEILSDREYATRLFDRECTHHEVHRPLLKFRTTGISNTNRELLRTEQDLILANEFPFLRPDERRRLNNHAEATPETFISIANAHLDRPKFVKACRALLLDRKAHQGAKWQSGDVSSIGAAAHMDYPDISVILPFYAAENMITASLDSVLAQSIENFEVVCINDCAIDDSQAIVDEYSRRDRRIRSIRNAANLGLGASRNAGIREARGRFIFHLDPDDTIPPDALKTLHDLATAHGSALVKGAFRADQIILGRAPGAGAVKYPCGIVDRETINTTLSEQPSLLRSTEGHWSILYQAEFAQRVPYPTDLKMGQDSIFLVNAFARAPSITLTPEVVYNYQPNQASAMNTFNFRKFMDALEWRRRAWRVLTAAGHQEIGKHLLFNYWNEKFFAALEDGLSPTDKSEFYIRLRTILTDADYRSRQEIKNPNIRKIFDDVFGVNKKDANPRTVQPSKTRCDRAQTQLKIATMVVWDHGGAGQGSQRRVEALCRNNVNAEIYCVFKKTDKSHVRTAPLRGPHSGASLDEAWLKAAWRKQAVMTKHETPILKARELFSKTGAVVDFDKMKSIFETADVVHLHWVAGMLDYEKAPKYLRDKPVTWTLADMNAFTGGCHYSEGCDGYKRECRDCPLLGGSDLAHQNWKIKKRAYDALQNLHIICPSQWLAHCAAESSLFSGRPIHVIPNALPIDRFHPTNKLTARRKLGLPLDKKLVVFGAADVKNRRKGGDILAASMKHLIDTHRAESVEGIFFGANALEIGVKAHNMGHVSDERKLSTIYAAADAYAFPSREDNAPLTIAEALLSGTPAVAFPVGNVPELVVHRKTGYIARYEDVEDFANGLAWALDRTRATEALARSVRCATKVRRHNDPDRSAKMHIELYESIIGRDGYA